MQRFLQTICLSFILLTYSCNTDSTTNSDEENPHKVLWGTVCDKEYAPLIDASISLQPSGYSTSTDSSGYFAFDSLNTDSTYTLVIDKESYWSDTLNPISLENDSTEVEINLIKKTMIKISGKCDGEVDSVKRVLLTISDTDYKCDWDKILKMYSTHIPCLLNTDSMRIEIKAFADSTRIIGYKTHKGSYKDTSITVESFDVENAKPTIKIETNLEDTTFKVGDTVTIRYSASDSYGSIKNYYFKSPYMDDTAIVDSGACSFIVDSSSDALSGFIAVSDSHGNTDIDSFKIQTNFQDLFSTIIKTDTHISSSGIVKTSDGHFLIAGTSITNGFYEPLIIKLASNGDTLWTKKIKSSGSGRLLHIFAAKDGHFFITGDGNQTSSDIDQVYISKITGEGTVIWENYYSKLAQSTGNFTTETRDGGVVIAGHYKDGPIIGGNMDLLILKYNKDGQLEWEKTYKGLNDEFGNSVIEISNGNLMVVGSHDGPGNSSSIWLLNCDQNGDTLWTKKYGHEFGARGECIINNNDNTFFITGMKEGFNEYDTWLLKVDSLGDTLWSKVYVGLGMNNVNIMAHTPTKGVVMCSGSYDLETRVSKALLRKTDHKGNLLWDVSIDVDTTLQQPDLATSVINANGGGYVMSGFSNGKVFAIKVDEEGNYLELE